MKQDGLKRKLTLNRETLVTLTPEALESAQGGLTPAIVSFVLTCLSCGFFCNPNKAR
jgi:hypothetical protein